MNNKENGFKVQLAYLLFFSTFKQIFNIQLQVVGVQPEAKDFLIKIILLLKLISFPITILSSLMLKKTSKAHLYIDSYAIQSQRWPQEGRHIMAQYDESSIVVYQAYNPSIAKTIVKSQNFHSEQCKEVGYSMNRMTWIKPNFLWMMYRSGWASKKDQERILAIRLKRQGFEEILSKSIQSKLDQEKNEKPGKNDPVRLQWDPDHLPNGEKHKLRKAIQLGLRGQMLEKMSKEFIVNVEDITELVVANRDLINNPWNLQVPKQDIYPIDNEELAKSVGISKVTKNSQLQNPKYYILNDEHQIDIF